MAALPFFRKGIALAPATQEGRDAVNRMDDGAGVMIRISGARNIRQFRLWWVLCEVVAEHYDVTKEAIKEELCIACGHSVVEWQRDGSFRVKPKSIAFENLAGDEFDRLFQLAIGKVCEWMGTAPKELRDHVYELIDGKRASERKPRQIEEPE